MPESASASPANPSAADAESPASIRDSAENPSADTPSAATSSPQPSPHGGMGAVLHADGTTFRVWAPDVRSVSVAGTFNGWNADAHPLAHEGHGYWSAHVAGAAEGDRYRFVLRTDGGVLEPWRQDPYARDVDHSNGDCVIVDPAYRWTAEFRMPGWYELVIYELHVGTFNDVADPLNEPGTLRSAIDRLDYLRDLGINCIEIMPASEFATDVSLGYNPAHIFAVEQAYGGPAGLKQLVDEAHARGIAVILDVVYNHLGPSDLATWRFNGWAQPDWTDLKGRHEAGGIYFYGDWRASTPWGDTRPDYRRGEVRQFLRDNALAWLQEYRFDGLRWDMTPYIRNVKGGSHPGDDLPEGWDFARWVNAEVNARQPWKLLIAEDLQTDAAVTRHPDQGGAGFDSQWDAQFVHPVRRALITPDDAARDMGQVAHAIAFRYDGDPMKRVIYTESHDEVMNGRARVPHDINPSDPASRESQKRSTLGAALVFTSPGIPMIFMGQEFLEDEFFQEKVPLDWSRLQRFEGIHALYRDLVRLRRNGWDTTRGLRGPHVDVHHTNHGDKLIAFHRWQHGGPRDDVIVLANFSNRAWDGYTIGFPRLGEWKVRLNSDWQGYSGAFGNHPSHTVHADGPPADGKPCSGAVGIGAYTAIILSQD
ncbi:MAG TPA: alpha-amylase family glycosyl hydrolase [Longimicrobium sp.]|nr:alpha-amylase family glycosyl hydrolase [Longimicrobium sp.]